MPRLRDSFLAVRPRETSGSETGDRFQYQWNWALAHILELHECSQDYLIAFDYHDDVIEFDSSADPSLIRFYQVKTKKSGEWKLTDLLTRKKGKQKEADGEQVFLLSHVGKMYSNKILFPECTETISFVTNAPLKLKCIHEDSPRKIRGSDLIPMSLSKITKQMMEEHRLTEEPELRDLLIFEQCALTVEDHANQLIGRLNNFLENLYPERKFQIGAIYRALIGEITLRSKPGSNTPGDFDEFVETRCISRDEFSVILGKAGAGSESPEDVWSYAEAQLQSEEMRPVEIRSIRSAWRRHEVDRRDPNRYSARDLSKVIRQVISKITADADASAMTMRQILDLVLSDDGVKTKSLGLFDSAYIRAVALMEFYES